jgi:hypothetical protein
VKCIRCGHDSKYRERTGRICPRCRGRFAFEPREGDQMTDPGFQACIQQVSSNGQVRWGVENLYYEVCRRENRRASVEGPRKVGIAGAGTGAGAAVLAVVSGQGIFAIGAGVAALVALFNLGTAVVRSRRKYAPVPLGRFHNMWRQWVQAHGTPESVIVRPEPEKAPPRPVEADIGDYSFDRAVICDRARTVDLLLANNFHFENNCAILSVDGYPPGPFETVRAMLKRNPRLQVFALHDATYAGCALAHRLTNDPAWFQGPVPVVDVGLRPSHAGPFRGLLLLAGSPEQRPQGLTPDEQAWLTEHTLELAAVRPEQVIKRLYRAINRQVEEDTSSGDGGGGGDGGVWIASSGDGGTGVTAEVGAAPGGPGPGGPGPGGLQEVSDSLAGTLNRTSDVLASGGGSAWSGGGAGDLGGRGGGSGGGSSGFDAGVVIFDFESFSVEATASDGGADSFG